MLPKFKPIYIPIVLSIVVVIVGLCLAGAVIYPVISNGFAGEYIVDASDITAFVRLILVMYCIAVLIVFGTGIAVTLAVIWGLYCGIELIILSVKNRGKMIQKTFKIV